MYYLNLLTPLYADDFAYRFSFADKGLKIHNLESLIQLNILMRQSRLSSLD